MQSVLNAMMTLKQQTEGEEAKLQQIFTMLLRKVRETFDFKSNLLRADFVELQRQETELSNLEQFIKGEVSAEETITSIQTY